MKAKAVLFGAMMTVAVAMPGLASADPVLDPVVVTGTRTGGWTTICEGMGCAGLFDQGPTFDPMFEPLPLGNDGGVGEEDTEKEVAPGTTVNPIKKTVRTNDINCTATPGETNYYAGYFYLGSPTAKVGTEITIYGGNDASWKYKLGKKGADWTHIRISGGSCP